jgi:Tfp pilus assembly protein PilP
MKVIRATSSILILYLWICSVHAGGVISAPTQSNYDAVPQNYAEPRDPFTTSERMYAEVGNQAATLAGSGQGFVAGYGPQTVPKMKLKGFVNRGAKKIVALLEVEGAGVYLVSEGDEIGLQAIGQNSVIKVIKVDANGVRVQAGRVNQVIVVR